MKLDEFYYVRSVAHAKGLHLVEIIPFGDDILGLGIHNFFLYSHNSSRAEIKTIIPNDMVNSGYAYASSESTGKVSAVSLSAIFHVALGRSYDVARRWFDLLLMD